MFQKQSSGPEQKTAVLSNWLSSTCLIVNGVSVSRRDVVKYVANKLGGVHVDPSRNSKGDQGYIALDEARNGVRVLDLDSVYAELTAIGQQFAKAIESESLV